MRTAEAVSKGHVDKVCDQISDAILDAILEQDKDSRVAIETMGGHGIVTIAGEVTTRAVVDMVEIAKRVYREIGYEDEIGVTVNIVKQSPDIALGVDTGGAGDQGIVVGYACRDTIDRIPQELLLARQILQGLPKEFGPDAKSQVTINEEGKIVDLVLSAQHSEGQDIKPLEDYVDRFCKYRATSDCKKHINPTGKFVIGGFAGDTGLTGRKIVNDAYGPRVPVGGGAYSGKDMSKIDRSAAYMARYIAIQFLEHFKDQEEATVRIAYSIGIAEPVSLTINGSDYLRWAKDMSFALTPKAIREFLRLDDVCFYDTAKWGAYGEGFNWDK